MITNTIDQLELARKTIREEIAQDKFSIHARFSGGECICGELIEEGEFITSIAHCPRSWIHLRCAELEMSETKRQSKAWVLVEKLAKQAIDKEAVWRDDLLELAKLAFLGKWSLDYWIEDTVMATQILDLFGLHRLTTGWRSSTDKARQKYAQKIEKEFAKHKGWICRICRRLIWVEKSVKLGIGPVCRKHLAQEQASMRGHL